jgi:hypothetical protein
MVINVAEDPAPISEKVTSGIVSASDGNISLPVPANGLGLVGVCVGAATGVGKEEAVGRFPFFEVELETSTSSPLISVNNLSSLLRIFLLLDIIHQLLCHDAILLSPAAIRAILGNRNTDNWAFAQTGVYFDHGFEKAYAKGLL